MLRDSGARFVFAEPAYLPVVERATKDLPVTPTAIPLAATADGGAGFAELGR